MEELVQIRMVACSGAECRDR